MARSSNNKSKGKQSGMRSGKSPSQPKFSFVQGEISLPAKVVMRSVTTDDDCSGIVKVPVPDSKNDYPDGKTVGWIIQASFAEAGKAKFLGTNSVSGSATLKVPEGNRNDNIELHVVGGSEETYAVVFRILPKIVNEISFHS